ncbi:MAG: nucleotidyltransferase domain-containing protein [Chlorobium phaeobacteroides]|uniref:DNA polymerase beta domain protein region n=1 Tax=Chlorobium phaeobacteroides (strain BS1) TaxID=331678 RepID=B3EKY6_CHLPB|nr:nucleotidyltransferase domain-containing protein [Chlorobium phaeobacteroides]
MHAKDSKNGEIKRLRQYIENRSDVSFAMVFGSFARGKERKGSDLDVAIFFLEDVVPQGFDVLVFEQELSDVAEREVDLVILNSAGIFLRHQIQKCHQMLVLHSKLAYERYRERTMQDYDEYRYLNPEKSYA